MTKEIILGDRFRSENGEDMPFTIRTITGKEYEDIKNRTQKFIDGEIKADIRKANIEIVVNACTYPNFKDAETLKAAGCMLPGELVEKALLPGEVAALAGAILNFSGYNTKISDLVTEAKN